MAYRTTSGKPGSTRMAMSSLMEENPRDAKEVGEELLSNIGRQVLALLSKGGDKARQFDDAYSARVREAIYPEKLHGQGGPMGAVRGIAAEVVGSPLGHGLIKNVEINKKPFLGERALAAAVPYAVPAVSAGVRYGVPLGAAAGLANLTGRLYDAASEEEIY